MTKILTTTKSLLVIPQMDLQYNIKKLAEWRAKQDKENGKK
jgi:hypothetical protein